MDNKPILLLLEENELNISALYSLYARKIPHKSAFWEQLSNEEISHASSLGNDSARVDPARSIVENKFSRGVIQYVMDFVLEEIRRAEKENVTHFDALQTALRIERSILEKKCFDMFMPADTTIQELFQKMNDETEQHIRTLTEEIESQGT
ncbi:MAG: hypothetical protein Q8L10_02790 [Candidatus Moranbacteria bacterium]|nr:hypothetical protein [Candidatus Moranbacteria bacterium]